MPGSSRLQSCPNCDSSDSGTPYVAALAHATATTVSRCRRTQSIPVERNAAMSSRVPTHMISFSPRAFAACRVASPWVSQVYRRTERLPPIGLCEQVRPDLPRERIRASGPAYGDATSWIVARCANQRSAHAVGSHAHGLGQRYRGNNAQQRGDRCHENMRFALHDFCPE